MRGEGSTFCLNIELNCRRTIEKFGARRLFTCLCGSCGGAGQGGPRAGKLADASVEQKTLAFRDLGFAHAWGFFCTLHLILSSRRVDPD